MRPRNPYRHRMMRAAYDEAVHAYEKRSSVLFLNDGSRHRGNGVAGPFWLGFEGELTSRWDPASKLTLAYAYWRAGSDLANIERHRYVQTTNEIRDASGNVVESSDVFAVKVHPDGPLTLTVGGYTIKLSPAAAERLVVDSDRQEEEMNADS